MRTNQEILPLTQAKLEEVDAQTIGIGSRLNTSEFMPMGIVPVFSEQYDPSVHNPSQIDYRSSMAIATGEPYVTHKFGIVPLRVEVVSGRVSKNDISEIAELKQSSVNTITNLVEASLPRMGDHVVNHGAVFERDILGNQERDADIRIVIGDFASVGAGLARPSYEATPTVLVKVNHILERDVPPNIGTVQLAANQEPLDTSNSEKLQNYNHNLELVHQEQVSRLEKLDTCSWCTNSR